MMQKAEIACLLVVALAGVVSAQNLVKDPGFESAGTSGAGAWGLLAAAGTNGAVARIDATQGHSGGQCLLLDQTHPLVLPDGATTASNLVRFLQANKAGGSVSADQTVPAEGGKTYNLSFWYKAEGLLARIAMIPSAAMPPSTFLFTGWMMPGSAWRAQTGHCGP